MCAPGPSGRFPKRELTKEWRQLSALILDIAELILTEDHVAPKIYEGEDRTFNSDSFWNDSPPELPPVGRRVWRRPAPNSPGRSSSAPASPPRTAASPTHTGRLAAGAGLGTGLLPSIPPGTASSMRAGGGGGQIGVELTINRSLDLTSRSDLPAGSGAAGEVPRCTFGAANEFREFSRGLEVMDRLAVDGSGGTAGLGPGSSSMLLASGGSLPRGVRAWNATLPPTAIHLPVSALQTLRSSVRSVVSSQADFQRMHRTLDTSDLDQKKVLGQPVDTSVRRRKGRQGGGVEREGMSRDEKGASRVTYIVCYGPVSAAVVEQGLCKGGWGTVVR